jgi:hypothetical protein
MPLLLAIASLVLCAYGVAVIVNGPRKKCPFCAEKIKRQALVCKHCGRDL